MPSKTYLLFLILMLATTCVAGLLHASVVFPVVSAAALFVLSLTYRQDNGFDNAGVSTVAVIAASAFNASAASAAAFMLGYVSIIVWA